MKIEVLWWWFCYNSSRCMSLGSNFGTNKSLVFKWRSVKGRYLYPLSFKMCSAWPWVFLIIERKKFHGKCGEIKVFLLSSLTTFTLWNLFFGCSFCQSSSHWQFLFIFGEKSFDLLDIVNINVPHCIDDLVELVLPVYTISLAMFMNKNTFTWLEKRTGRVVHDYQA